MLDYLKEWKETGGSGGSDGRGDRPFFGYLPFTAPHWPLQAPREYIDHYHGVYDEGPDVLRQKRLRHLKELGMVRDDVEPHPVQAEVKPWEEYSATAQKAPSTRLIRWARTASRLICRNTTITASKTLETVIRSSGTARAGHRRLPRLHVLTGLALQSTEGGVSVLFTCRFPTNLNINPLNVAAKGGITDQFATVMDLAPSILDMAGTNHPAPTYQGCEIVEMRGRSFHPWAVGEVQRMHPVDFIRGWETWPGAMAVIQSCARSGEIHDLSDAEPEKLKQLLKLWDQYVLETGLVPLCPSLGEFLEATEAQMPEKAWMEFDYWTDGARDQPGKFSRQPPRFQRTVKPF
ncbi:hypothetical protein N7457_004184 [Penicillium paradoxum]|uniref:uncharacterized protein n=1 Tax=Penicillium paradoxum TaxID=176176 RepID=UPI0025482DA7|nr:uncharacterized protein N7457_004184 [Penicillium paradoxum]KAJ5782410.1 hypothetical protein N7457_004184 [Penicillium paradoxum]